MDDETNWQDAALPADSRLIGPPRPDAEASGDGSDYDELETGIASIFAAMQAAGPDGAPDDAPTGDAAARDEDGPSGEDAHTFQLLSELDRLWQRPSP